MKHMNMIKKYGRVNLQIFAEGEENDGDNGDDSGDDDNEGDDGDGGGGDPEDKLFSQADVDKAIEKRIAREKRKWKREQAKEKNPDGKDKAGDNNDPDKDKNKDPEVDKLKAKASKAEELELKWTCIDHDVDKTCVDDVLALAKVNMAKDEHMDIEDAIDKVLKKYPQFKVASKDDEDDEENKSWGQRQKSKNKQTSGVEAAFLKKNPGLKID